MTDYEDEDDLDDYSDEDTADDHSDLEERVEALEFRIEELEEKIKNKTSSWETLLFRGAFWFFVIMVILKILTSLRF